MPNLWVTDGTAAGTSEVTVAGPIPDGLTPSDITALPPPPAAPSGLALAAGSDSGVKGDDITNVTKPVITGTGVAGDTVTLYDGATRHRHGGGGGGRHLVGDAGERRWRWGCTA